MSTRQSIYLILSLVAVFGGVWRHTGSYNLAFAALGFTYALMPWVQARR